MKGSRTVFLFVLVLGLAGYILLVERHNMSAAEKNQFEKQAFQVDADRLIGLEIRTPNYEVELVRREGDWALRHPEGARASEAMIKRTLSRLETLQRGELITPQDMRQRGVSLADFGLYVPKTILTLQTDQGQREYRIGDPNPLKTSVYIKEEASQNVMLVSTDLLEILPERKDIFYDPNLFSLEVEQVESFSLVRSGETVHLQQASGQWAFTEPRVRPADSQQVAALLTKLLKATAEGFVNEPEDGGEYGFQNHAERFRIESRRRPVAEELILGGDVPDRPGLIYAQLEGRGGILQVSKGLRQLARTPVDALRPATLMPPDLLSQIASLEVEHNGAVMTLERREGRWFMVKPLERPAAGERVESLLTVWSSARIVAFDQSLEGFQVSHTLRFKDASGRLLRQFDLLKGAPVPGRSMVRDVSSGETVRVTPDLTPLTSFDPTAYLPMNLVTVNPSKVVRIDLTRGDRRLEFTRSGPGEPWSLDGGLVAQSTAVDLLNTLVRLEAVRLRRGTPEDRTRLGLDQAELRISMGLAGDNPANLTLLLSVGSQGENGLAAILGDELVYEISEHQSNVFMSLFQQVADQNPTEEPSDEEATPVP